MNKTKIKQEEEEKQTAKSFTDWIIGNNIEYLDLDEDTRDWYYKRFKETYQGTPDGPFDSK